MSIPTGSTIGIIGGGQLGRMTALAAANLGYKVCIYTNQNNSPASHVAEETIVAEYDDSEALQKFAALVDVITFEFENIPHKSVQILEDSVPVRPSWQALHISQNRLREKDYLNSIGVKTAPYKAISSVDDLTSALDEIGPKAILKTTELGYDGKGQFVIDGNSNLDSIWKEINSQEAVLEGMVPFVKEVSVVIARGVDGESQAYTAVENIHKNGILDTTIAPAEIAEEISVKAQNIAKKVADSLDYVGVLAVEMFVLDSDDVLVNEIAPRPHNSGHWTMDACYTSQFEQCVRAVCGLPLGGADYHSKAIMTNLIGKDIHQWESIIKEPNAKLHLYGKKEARAGRKMGHVNRPTS
jgi:5-(carboxyamino)imidazole ribonucleotide synthase